MFFMTKDGRRWVNRSLLDVLWVKNKQQSSVKGVQSADTESGEDRLVKHRQLKTGEPKHKAHKVGTIKARI